MKRIQLFLFLVSYFSLMMLAGAITVKTPKLNETVLRGQVYDITWQATGCEGNSYIVNIFRDSISQANFVEQLKGNNPGLMCWNIPANYPTGNYILRVKTEDNLCVGDSQVFRIVDKLITPGKAPDFTLKKKITLSPGLLDALKRPDLTISVGCNVNPVNHKTYFNMMVSNKGSGDTPSVTHDKLIIYYWGPNGDVPPQMLMELFKTQIPVIKAGANHLHVIEYIFTQPGKYTYSAHVNIQEMKAFEESDFLNNSVLPAKEFWVGN